MATTAEHGRVHSQVILAMSAFVVRSTLETRPRANEAADWKGVSRSGACLSQVILSSKMFGALIGPRSRCHTETDHVLARMIFVIF